MRVREVEDLCEKMEVFGVCLFEEICLEVEEGGSRWLGFGG